MMGRGWGDEDEADHVESRLDEQAQTVRQCLQAVARQAPGNYIAILSGRSWLGDVQWEQLPLLARIQELYPGLLDSPARMAWHELKGFRVIEGNRATIVCDALRDTDASEVWQVFNGDALQELLDSQNKGEGEGAGEGGPSDG